MVPTARPRGPARALAFGPADARALVAYNHDAFDRFARKVRRLPAREATRRREIGHQSLFETLVHVLNVHEVWMVYIVPGRHHELDRLFADPSRHPSDWAGFRTYADRVWSGVERTVGTLGPRALSKTVRAPWMAGRYTTRDAILQTTLEQAHHLGEIIGALWQDDVRPPEMTWLDLLRASARPRAGRRSR